MGTHFHLIIISIPFGHGWKLSYLMHFAEHIRRAHGMIETALITPAGSVKVL